MSEENVTSATSAETLNESLLTFVKDLRQKDDIQIIEYLSNLFQVYGNELINAWCSNDKNKNKLVHLLTQFNKQDALCKFCSSLNINDQREKDGCTPLHIAAWTKNDDLIHLLLKIGGNPKIQNKYGETTEVRHILMLTTLIKVLLHTTYIFKFNSKETVKASKMSSNIVFLDLELTSVRKPNVNPKILEIAVIVTDSLFSELERYSCVISVPPESLVNLGDFHDNTFKSTETGGNGLYDDIQTSGIELKDAEKVILELIKRHCKEKSCKLAGFSIHCDREVRTVFLHIK